MRAFYLGILCVLASAAIYVVTGRTVALIAALISITATSVILGATFRRWNEGGN